MAINYLTPKGLRNPEQSYEILNEHKNVSYAFKVCIANKDIYANIPDEIRELVDKLFLYRATDDNENVGLKFLNEVHAMCDKLVHYIKTTNKATEIMIIRNLMKQRPAFVAIMNLKSNNFLIVGAFWELFAENLTSNLEQRRLIYYIRKPNVWTH